MQRKAIFLFWSGLLLLFSSITPVMNADQKLKALIITGQTDLPYHVWQETTVSLRSILNRSGRFDLRVTEEPRGITRAALQGYKVLILNYNGPRWPAEAETAIEAFVTSGGGLVAFHQSSYGEFFGQVKGPDGRWQERETVTGWTEFRKMIGAWWRAEDIGHARRTVFQVDWKDRNHPISRGLPASFVANDELYHKLQLSSQVHVLADGLSPANLGGTGRREPLVWTNRYGKGRVFYTVLGHDTLSWYEPGTANLLARGTEWAATGKVTIPPVRRGRREAGEKDVRLLVVTEGHTYPTEFYSLLASLPHVFWTHAVSRKEAFRDSLVGRYDTVLLHDMGEKTEQNTRNRLKEFVESGGGVVSLHHAIVDYTDWPWWYREVIGGKYFVQATEGHAASSYEEGIEFLVQSVSGKENHPILRGVGPLWVHDEVYKGMLHSPGIEVLMETSHPGNDRPVVYVGPYSKSRIVYIQLGHSGDTMGNPGFRKLVSNAVRWVSGKEGGE